MNVRAIAYVMGTLLLVTAGAMVLPAICTLFYWNEGDLPAFVISAVITAALGALTLVIPTPDRTTAPSPA